MWDSVVKTDMNVSAERFVLFPSLLEPEEALLTASILITMSLCV
jgi:hypothetical protein